MITHYSTKEGKRISKSLHHKEMWIVNHEDGYHFHNITISDEAILLLYKRVRNTRILKPKTKL